jgi:DNA-directed RNA polymerase specialized sigma subunit
MVDISAQRAEEPRRNRSRTIRPELAFYRKHTEGMLRRYVSMSLESGRVPSLLGKEMFRGNVTSYKVNSFEDVVIFIHDMERCIGRLDERQQRLIRRIAVQQFTLQEVAGMLKVPRTSVLRLYNETINRLTGVLLEVKLLEPFAY